VVNNISEKRRGIMARKMLYLFIVSVFVWAVFFDVNAALGGCSGARARVSVVPPSVQKPGAYVTKVRFVCKDAFDDVDACVGNQATSNNIYSWGSNVTAYALNNFGKCCSNGVTSTLSCPAGEKLNTDAIFIGSLNVDYQ